MRASAWKKAEDEKEEAREKGHAEGLAAGLAEGRAEGLAEGLAEGRSESLIEIAKKMILDNIPFETIAKYTSCTVQEIQKIAKTINK